MLKLFPNQWCCKTMKIFSNDYTIFKNLCNDYYCFFWTGCYWTVTDSVYFCRVFMHTAFSLFIQYSHQTKLQHLLSVIFHNSIIKSSKNKLGITHVFLARFFFNISSFVFNSFLKAGTPFWDMLYIYPFRFPILRKL